MYFHSNLCHVVSTPFVSEKQTHQMGDPQVLPGMGGENQVSSADSWSGVVSV